MNIEIKASIYFSVSCFISAATGTYYLWNFVGDNAYIILGIKDKQYLLLIPIITTVFAAYWGRRLSLNLLNTDITPITTYRWFGTGLLVALSTFLSYTFIHALIAAYGVPLHMYIMDIIPIWLSFSMFGFIMFGWALIIVGGLTGVLFSQLNTNKSLNQIGANNAPPG